MLLFELLVILVINDFKGEVNSLFTVVDPTTCNAVLPLLGDRYTDKILRLIYTDALLCLDAS